ncbi:superfamily II DNA/RNA helicase [Pelomonas saccharophila]|uniref:Superfamily II DNA/RNA helicase n=1 Tax=Roseateles saccharophilus TaxID=304 RepID=A0ABU1YGN7_ROSSA|nr:DEAD/DEAH box helicase [Roseateles saccharophilus]MDR7268019.1 superfamily II DNA/RNA helicase [Roseateles saccharophilus]
MSFENLGLSEVVLKAVKDSGYENATDVQGLAIPAAIANKDLMVSARTGSGKTAAFILPALEKILAARGDDSKRREKGKIYGPKILVLAPTRELAMQVAKAAQTYGRFIPGLKVATVLGGMPYPLQIRQLTGPLDILIATPGRLIDHIQSGKCVLGNVEMLVLDEADRMLDMGFIDDITMIAGNTPVERQTVMFSATFAGHVGRLAQSLLKDPQRIEVASHTDTHENIEQRLHWADNPHHKDQLLESILAQPELDQAVVFTSTQRDADWLADRLAELGHAVAPLHGAMPQGKRNRVLMGLRRGDLKVLVATDVAARGIDVPTISHVINYGLPMKAEDYVHRIGRTGRAGRQGLAITLGLRDDVSMIRRIQQFTTQTIPVQHIAGLEPKTQEPRIFPPRPAGSFDDRGPRGNFGGRPGFGNKPFRREDGGRPFHGGGKPFNHGNGGQDRGFAPRDDRGFAPRGEQRGFAPRGDAPAFQPRDERGFQPRENRGFQPREDRGFAPREDRGFQPREDRGFQPREDRGFAPRGEQRPFQPGAKPSFGAKPAFGDRRPPSGPRKGGFGR